MSRFILRLRALFFRALQSFFTLFDLYLSHPLPQRVSFTKRIKSTVSSIPRSFDLLFYTPPHYTKSKNRNTQKHPLLINFHGGGFVIGHAGDDARWATAVTSQSSGVVVSVNYRLAPEHPSQSESKTASRQFSGSGGMQTNITSASPRLHFLVSAPEVTLPTL